MRRAVLVAVVAALVAPLLPATEAAAAACPPAGGQPIRHAAERSSTHFVFAGRGFGHGVGMSQYGAQGAARLGCSVTDILTTYYRGVQIGRADTARNIRVGLVPNTATAPLATVATIENLARSDIPWKLESNRVATQAGGAKWQVRVTDEGRYRIVDVSGGQAREVWTGGSPATSLKAHIDGRLVRYHEKGRRYLRGTFEFRSELRPMPDSGQRRAGMYVTVDVPTIETYLYGLAEMPSSFPVAALQSQAVVGRSFAFRMRESGSRTNCRCHLYDSVQSQVYAGFEKEGEGTDRQWGRRWVAAVDATARKVIVHEGRVATGFYASSHGGHTSSGAYVWGGGAPYLQAVDDSHWTRASSDPNVRWETRFTREELGRVFGVGLALEVRLPDPKDAAGRIGDPDRGAGGMIVSGTQGRVRVSGNRARELLGLSTVKSTLFTVSSPPSPIFTGTPLVGDWNGDGRDQPGWFDRGTFYLRLAQNNIISFRYGRPTDLPVVGDWDGDGTDTVGVVRGNRWYLRNRHARGGGNADIVYAYGSPSDTPVAGDWNGDGTDTAGVVRGNRWYLRNRHTGTPHADVQFAYGLATDRPAAGDWNGDGTDTAGVVRGNRWYLRNRHTGSPHADIAFRYGGTADRPVVGDWDGNRSVTAGVVRGAVWYLANRHGTRHADVVLDLSGG